MLALLFLACNSAPSPTPASSVTYNEASVQEALATIESTLATLKPEEASSLSALEERVVQLELAIARMENQGVITAEMVGYDPRSTRLSGRKVQDAVDELEERLRVVEAKSRDGIGPAGEGLFALPEGDPHDPEGMGPEGRGPGGMGPEGMGPEGRGPEGKQRGGQGHGGQGRGGQGGGRGGSGGGHGGGR